MSSPIPFALVIGDKNLSSWSLRPWLAMKMANIPFEEIQIWLDRPETAASIAQHSPSGLVPALKHGDLTLWDSLAIIEYCHECFPEAGLWPATLEDRALARAVSAEMHSGFAALRRHLPMKFAETRLERPADPQVDRDIRRVQQLWSECRNRHADRGPFLFGAFSGADAMYAPVVSRFRSYDVALPTELQAYADAVWMLPPMSQWLAGAEAERA